MFIGNAINRRGLVTDPRDDERCRDFISLPRCHAAHIGVERGSFHNDAFDPPVALNPHWRSEEVKVDLYRLVGRESFG